MSTNETADIQPKPKKRQTMVLALLFPLAIVLKMGLFLLLLGMLPTLFAASLIRRPGSLSIIAAFNFTGLFPDLLDICMQGGTPRVLASKLSELSIWVSAYGAAALGFAVVWLSPSIALLMMEGFYRGRMRHMEHLQKKLEEEWGPQVSGKE